MPAQFLIMLPFPWSLRFSEAQECWTEQAVLGTSLQLPHQSRALYPTTQLASTVFHVIAGSSDFSSWHWQADQLLTSALRWSFVLLVLTIPQSTGKHKTTWFFSFFRGQAEQPPGEKRQSGQAAELLGCGFLLGCQHTGLWQHQGHPRVWETLQTQSPRLVSLHVMKQNKNSKEIFLLWGQAF